MLSLNTLDRMSRFEQACNTAGSIDELDAVIINNLSDICSQTYSYLHLPPLADQALGPSQAIRYFGYPDGWPGWKTHSGFSSDEPFIEYIFSQSGPIWWDEVYSKSGKPENFDAVLSAMSEIGVQCGLVLPVFDSVKKSGLFSFGFTRPRSEFGADEISALQWACQIAHYRHMDLLIAANNSPEKLTA